MLTFDIVMLNVIFRCTSSARELTDATTPCLDKKTVLLYFSAKYAVAELLLFIGVRRRCTDRERRETDVHLLSGSHLLRP